jgi:hypothetical protein
MAAVRLIVWAVSVSLYKETENVLAVNRLNRKNVDGR